MVDRARHRRIIWATVSSILGISEDTARHRYTDRYVLRRIARFNRSDTPPTSPAALFAPTSSPQTRAANLRRHPATMVRQRSSSPPLSNPPAPPTTGSPPSCPC